MALVGWYWYVPEFVGCSIACDERLLVVDCGDVFVFTECYFVFRENGGAVVVARLSNGEEGCCNVVYLVAGCGFIG